ncbi:MAG: LLM class flavin-dependent oxidoreductase [Gammaproteobacteria bacterium]
MKFDLFYELSNPPFHLREETRLFAETLDEIAYAETLGFDTAWLVEHHFMPGYSHASAPELFLAALTQRTRRLRLGHAIVPLPYNHPVRVAERIASLDVLSGGRIEFGFGRGFSPKEYASFGVAMGDSRSYTQESLEIIQRAFASPTVSYQGRHFQLDEVEITPSVVQQPHPPIWTAAVSPDSFDMAARLGIGVLVGPFKPWFMVREDIRQYREAWRKYHGDAPLRPGQNRRVAMTVGMFCHEDARAARRIANEPFVWFYRQLLGQTRPILEKLYDSFEYYRKMGRFRGMLDMAVNLKLLDSLGMAIVGDPEHCIRELKTLQAEGVDHVLLAFGAGAMPTETIRGSMRLFSEQVMPALRETAA